MTQRKSLHPGGKRWPGAAPSPGSAYVAPEPEEVVFNPEGATAEPNPFPEEIVTTVTEVVEEVIEAVTTPDYESMTVAELKALLSERGLAVSGTKAELIARLEADDAGPAEEEAAPVEDADAPADDAAASEESPEEGEVSESGGTE